MELPRNTTESELRSQIKHNLTRDVAHVLRNRPLAISNINGLQAQERIYCSSRV